MNYMMPRYLKIAVNICERIVSGDIVEGSNLKGRSVLSTEYRVSSETIRRAMSLLSDKNVVEISSGRGNVVLSKENAVQFLLCFKDDERIRNLHLKLTQAYEKRVNIDREIADLTEQIFELNNYRHSNFIQPIEIPVPSGSHIIGHSIGELEIWHNTGATIIGIISNQVTILSPGPYFEFSENDKIIIVGDKNVTERFNAYIIGIS